MTRRVRKKATKPEVLGVGRMMVHTRITDKDGEIEVLSDDFEEMEVQKFETDPAYVRVGVGVTKRLRDYESLRVDVALTLPCYTEQKEENYRVASDWVADKVMNEVDAYMEGSGDDD